jgi:hypothetical protein
MIRKRETPQAVKKRGTVKVKYARFSGPVLRGIVLIVALCAFIPFLALLPYGGGIWEVAAVVFFLANFTLAVVIPKPEALPAIEGEGTARPPRLLDCSLVGCCAIIGLGFNWVSAFLWFSRQYALLQSLLLRV